MQKKQYQGPQPQIAVAPVDTIRAGPGLGICLDEKRAGKYERLIEKRGNIVPITATYSENGGLNLTDSYYVYSAYQNSGASDIPVIIAETAGEADALMLTLEIMAAYPTDQLAVSSCLCKLIDDHLVPRNVIAEALGKSLPWVSLAERIGRRLTPAVKEMLSHGKLCMRSAMEIAMLPDDVQKPFANKAVSYSLNKNQVSQWVTLYTAPERSQRDKDVMISDPVAYLKAVQKKKTSMTGYMVFRRTLLRCKTAVNELSRIIDTLPYSAIDDVCNQLQELQDDVTELSDHAQGIFTRVNMGDEA